MKRTISFIILLIIFRIVSAQNDTLYLESECVIWRGEKYNQTNNSGHKHGSWLYYGIKEMATIEIVDWDGDLWCGTEFITKEYRPLESGEHHGMKKVVSEKIDSVKGYMECRFEVIYNKVTPKSYYIKSEGEYNNDSKIGEWKYYHDNDSISRVVKYHKGIPEHSFDMFCNDGSLIMSFIKLPNNQWELVRFSKEGAVLSTKQINVKDFSEIY